MTRGVRNRVPFTEDLWERYLTALQETGVYITAADTVNTSGAEAKLARDRDPLFAALCEDALDRFKAGFHQSAAIRARDGFVVPIMGGRNRDEVVAHERKYSDGLMAMFLKRHDPSFREKQEIEMTGTMNFRQHFDLGALSTRARAKLRELLEIIKEDEKNGATGADIVPGPPMGTFHMPDDPSED